MRFLICLFLLVVNGMCAQTPILTPKLDEIITKYLARTDEYSAAFKNLTAEETKEIAVYEADGTLKSHRSIVSELLVYQPTATTGQNWTAEYRSVRSVDSQPLPDAEKRAVKLFEQIAKAKSSYDEWERVRKEWAKYDIGQSWWGFTINQGVAVKASRSYYGFALLGTEEQAGRKVLIVYYRQLAPSPNYTGPIYLINNIRLPAALRSLPPLFVGKLWLDAETYQIWREERAMVIYPPNEKFAYGSYQQMRDVLASPAAGQLTALMLARWKLSYQPSEFGILTPREIEISFYNHFRQEKTETGLGKPELLLGHQTRYLYSSFKRFNVTGEETKREIIKDEPKAKQP